MTSDTISEISIDNDGRLLIKPAQVKLRYIWREAAEVHWDDVRSALYSPKPREWSYLDWYNHIVAVAASQCCMLLLTNTTQWVNVPPEVQAAIKAANPPPCPTWC